jgi:hypothetical protein
MTHFQRATYALITAAVLGLSAPTAPAADRANDGDPSDAYVFKFIIGKTSTETTIVDGKPLVKITTTVSCGPSGNDCKLENGNFVPKGAR